MSKVQKEFQSVITVHYPTRAYPQDLIDQIVMPALRRSYDRARRENWKLAKETMSKFDMVTGPVEPCEDVAGYMHSFGWYVAVELEEDEKEEVSNHAVHH